MTDRRDDTALTDLVLEDRLRGYAEPTDARPPQLVGDVAYVAHETPVGRLQLYDKPGSLKDRTLRLAIQLADGRELRLREFGTRQSAWAKLLRAADLEAEPNVAKLGPEAWPDPPPLEDLLDDARPLHSMLRDQRVLAGIGRSWADEILHTARLSPFKTAAKLSDDEVHRLYRAVVDVLTEALGRSAGLPASGLKAEKKEGLRVHGRTGQPCPVCGDTVREVSFATKSLQYCPTCQTGGKPLADRRLSRLLK